MLRFFLKREFEKKAEEMGFEIWRTYSKKWDGKWK